MTLRFTPVDYILNFFYGFVIIFAGFAAENYTKILVVVTFSTGSSPWLPMFRPYRTPVYLILQPNVFFTIFTLDLLT